MNQRLDLDVELLLRLAFGLAVACAAIGTAGCHHHRQGPGERAGAAVDDALDRTGDAIEHAGEKVNRALPGD
jgi:hypothetical protein